MSLLTTAETAYFAGGCFWCMQSDFDNVPGVTKTVVGYIGGTHPNPTYELVSSGTTNYAEGIEVTFDPNKISYTQLLQYFWHNVDPENARGQFCDTGHQYRSEIFYINDAQKKAAEQSKQALQKSAQLIQIATPISAAGKFYPAETYHQDYYKKNPVRYKFYRFNCGRDKRLKQLWGDKAHNE